MIRLVGGAHSDVGQVRANNQDAALSDPACAVFAVADGMGGHRGGEVASALALSTLSRQVRSDAPAGGALASVDGLVDAVLGANEAVFGEARGNSELHGMGTTLCAVALVGPAGAQHVAIVNVGDSRVYLLRDGALEQLTEDHSLVQSLVRDGQLTADEAAVHPQRNILTRVIGVEPDVEVDWWERPAVVGDRYLLCSDGLFNEVPDGRIAATLRQLADPTEAATTLVAMANDGGGRDNVTCVVVDVVDDDGGAAAPADPGPTAAAALATSLAPPAPPPEPVPRRFTGRVVAFLIVLVALAGATVFAVRLWARNNYFVAVDNGTVSVFRGRPDGILWFDPEVVDATDVRVSALTQAQQELVNEGFSTSSHAEALRWVTLLTTPTTVPPAVTTTTARSATTTSTTAPGGGSSSSAPTTVAPTAVAPVAPTSAPAAAPDPAAAPTPAVAALGAAGAADAPPATAAPGA
ncbi:MAG: Stp1/IreP family PP2C-type Ser/Thr phosphatase [Acidimicrobiia bacterium]